MTDYCPEGIHPPFARYCLLLATLYKRYEKERKARMYTDTPHRKRHTGYTRLTKDEKLALVEQWKGSGLGKEKFAKKVGVSYTAFHKWTLGRGLTKLWRDEA